MFHKKTILFSWLILLIVSCKQQGFSGGGVSQGIGSYEAPEVQTAEAPDVKQSIGEGFGDQGEPSDPEGVPIVGIAPPVIVISEPTPTVIITPIVDVPIPKRKFTLTSSVDSPFTGGAHTSSPAGLNCNKTSVSQCSAQFDEGTVVQMFAPQKIFVSNFFSRSETLAYTGFWRCNGRNIIGVLTSKGASFTITMDRDWNCGAHYQF